MKNKNFRAAVLGTGLVGVLILARVAGCGTEPSLDEGALIQSEWPLRDVLGVAESQRRLSDEERSIFAHRAVDLGAVAAGEGAPVGVADGRFELLAALDALRQERGDDVIPFGLYGQDGNGAWSASCAPSEADFIDSFGAPTLVKGGDTWPAGYLLSEEWDQADSWEASAVTRLGGVLSRWSSRCGGQSENPEKVFVERAPQAPFLVAYWPQEARLYVHPMALELFAGRDADDRLGTKTFAQEFLTREQGLAFSSDFTQCTAEFLSFCDACDTQDEVLANPGYCSPIFTDSTPFDDCAKLLQSGTFGTFGAEMYCAYYSLNRRPSVGACVANNNVTCKAGTVNVVSVETLNDSFSQYGSDAGATCRELLTNCNNDPAFGSGEPPPDPNMTPKKKETKDCVDRTWDWLGCTPEDCCGEQCR
ncbi:MAG: hypothetical protein CO108_15725 [Deltaproteobacteria bacterium CG_4_9_14_3_um_filter_63_12]|nr:MAG: hypothetical protein CO108_15725 [Deltaproteobacteria bacterium CG_4_9_14_3_um_filter_63_12]